MFVEAHLIAAADTVQTYNLPGHAVELCRTETYKSHAVELLDKLVRCGKLLRLVLKGDSEALTRGIETKDNARAVPMKYACIEQQLGTSSCNHGACIYIAKLTLADGTCG